MEPAASEMICVGFLALPGAAAESAITWGAMTDAFGVPVVGGINKTVVWG